MQSYLPDYRPFVCKFCHDATLIYSETKSCYIDVETEQKHVCKKPDFASFIRVTRSHDPCTFCHSTENDRAAIHYKTPTCKALAQTIVCSSCTQKLFRVLVDQEQE